MGNILERGDNRRDGKRKLFDKNENYQRAMYIMQMLLNNAVQCGRLDQTMLANEEVVRITQILSSVIEITIQVEWVLRCIWFQ